MGSRFAAENGGIGGELLDILLAEHITITRPALARLWAYYRNDALTPTPSATGDQSPRPRLAQEQGLPDRLRKIKAGSQRDIVIENDIAWRIHALVDFMFGKPVVLQSCAPRADRARLLETFLREVIDRAGGASFLQHLALLGSVYGHVDILVRPVVDEPIDSTGDPLAAARAFNLEVIDAPRGLAMLHPGDYRCIEAFIIHQEQQLNEPSRETRWLDLIQRTLLGRARDSGRRATRTETQVWTAGGLQVFHRGRDGSRVRTLDDAHPFGRVPMVHIQNLPQPFHYSGLSEVEPLIPLQDELNTRLSDRANRVTMQSFKMYLGRGIEGFVDRPIGPGQMWATDNLDASISEFGGDANCPSETTHINELREAMDKTSAVTGVAAGLLRNKVGNLTSENALRIVMMGLLAKTEKKRVTYGAGIAQLCDLLLHMADVTGVLPNTPDERRIRIDWPSPLPEDSSARLRDAQIKVELGVPRRQVLAELGYGDCADE